ncbi:MAG: DegT/DnrJ/EryC1/StrS family aminotransferase [Candidatus Paceibacterota bacterium]|jgi:dTDP-4-amino-4,6-dideoxygalactose transaminase
MIGKEEREAVLRVMDRGILSGYRGSWGDWFYGGEEIKALEKEWAEYFHVKHVIACNSATSGLWLACAAVGLQGHKLMMLDELWHGEDYEPDEIIVSPYSMTCSASIPLHFGAMPVFADIEPCYFCLDPKSIESKITERTKAIIVVDLFGQPYDVDAINAIAQKHNVPVIEDAAQACGAKYKGKYAGTLGDIGVYSLNVHKHIQCGEGGIVVTDNDRLAFNVRLLLNHAEAVMNSMPGDEHTWSSCFDLVGLNLRMTELSAAISREQLKKLDDILKIYQEYANWFNILIRPECTSAYYKYAPKTKNGKVLLNLSYTPEMADKIFNFKQHYITPLYQLPLFKQFGYDQHQCPICEEVEKNIILAWFKEIV